MTQFLEIGWHGAEHCLGGCSGSMHRGIQAIGTACAAHLATGSALVAPYFEVLGCNIARLGDVARPGRERRSNPTTSRDYRRAILAGRARCQHSSQTSPRSREGLIATPFTQNDGVKHKGTKIGPHRLR